MLSAMSGAKDDSKDAHDLDKVYANTVMYSMLNSMVSSATGQSNNLPEFKKYLENPDNKIHDYISGIQYTYDMGFAVYTEDPNGTVIKADTTELLQNVMKSMYGGDYTAYFDSMGGFYSGFNVWQELLSGEDGELVSASTPESVRRDLRLLAAGLQRGRARCGQKQRDLRPDALCPRA